MFCVLIFLLYFIFNLLNRLHLLDHFNIIYASHSHYLKP